MLAIHPHPVQQESDACNEIIIARRGRPAARLVPLVPHGRDRRLRIGVARGRFAVQDPDTTADAEIQRLFEGQDA